MASVKLDRFSKYREIFYSLTVHGALVLFWLLSLHIQSKRSQDLLSEIKKKETTVQWVDLQNTPEKIKQRVVQTQKKGTDEIPKEGFLGERNQTVKHQTSSKTTVVANETNNPRAGQGAESQKQENVQNKKSVVSNSKASKVPLSTLGLNWTPKFEPQKTENESLKVQGHADDFVAKPSEYIKGMDEGALSALSTKQFVFYGYFQRIRQRLDQAWVPILRGKLIQLYKNGRRLASDQEHLTRVLVILNAGGDVVKVQILGQSGTEDLDTAAVEAFKKAGPFPNPPHGIVEASGEVRIPWEFILRS